MSPAPPRGFRDDVLIVVNGRLRPMPRAFDPDAPTREDYKRAEKEAREDKARKRRDEESGW